MLENTRLTVGSIDAVLRDRNEKEEKLSYSTERWRCELVYKLGGASIMHFDGKKKFFKKDDILFLPKGNISEYNVEITEPGEYIDIVFDTDSDFPKEMLLLCAEQNKRLGALFLKAQNIWQLKADDHYYKVMALLYEILAELNALARSYQPNDKLRRLDPAIDYIHRHYLDADFSYQALPELCNISYSYFKQLFRTKYGMPPKRYVTKLKLDYARELLSAGGHSVTEISELLGYDNVFYFSKVFKSVIGCPPSQYRPGHGR